MPTIITQEPPNSPDAMQLVAELDDVLSPLYAAESRHGFSVEKLLRDGVAFFVAHVDGEAAACGGILIVGSEYGEVKRMYVRPQFRGLGLARKLLDHLANYSRQQGVLTLRLETGIHQKEAIGLYESYGFQRILPFGPYWDDPVSLCYEKRLDADGA